MFKAELESVEKPLFVLVVTEIHETKTTLKKNFPLSAHVTSVYMLISRQKL